MSARVPLGHASHLTLAPGPGRRVIVAGDLHLSAERPEVTAVALRFLSTLTRENTALLVLLGDLVEYWVGDWQAREPAFRPLLAALAALGRRGVEVAFLPGNRDFLLGPALARAGVLRYRDWLWLALPGVGEVAITHGDLLAVNDRKYQRYRRLVRTPLVAGLARALPAVVTRRVGRALRAKSQRAIAAKPLTELLIPPAAERQVLRAGADVLVYGHVHRPEHRQIARSAPVGEWESCPPAGGRASRSPSGEDTHRNEPRPAGSGPGDRSSADVFVTGAWNGSGGTVWEYTDGQARLTHSPGGGRA